MVADVLNRKLEGILGTLAIKYWNRLVVIGDYSL